MRWIQVMILITCACFQLRSQNFDRLILLVDANRENPLLEAQSKSLQADFGRYFRTADIEIIYTHRDLKSERTSETPAVTIQEAMQKLNLLCQEPEKMIAVAFIFEKDDGPTSFEIQHALRLVPSTVKIINNTYFSSSLMQLGCGPNPIFNYAIGEVKSKDTIKVDEDPFPWIPVIGLAGLGTGIYFITKGKDEGCTTVDPSWIVPAGLCLEDAPLALTVSGTPGGTWSGQGVSASGVFDPSVGTQLITYTVGQGSCQQSNAQMIEVIDPNAGWNVPSSPCVGETITLTPFQSGGIWTGNGITQNPNGTADFNSSEPGQFTIIYSLTIGECTASEQHIIQVVPDADANWNPPEDLCTGEQIELIPTTKSGGHWTGEGVTDHGDGTATFSATQTGIFPVTYTAGTGECESSLTHQIEVNPNPDASWELPSGPLCLGEQFTLITAGAPGGTWSGTNVSDLGDGTGVFTATNSGAHAVTYTVTIGTCTTSLTQDIEVIEQADPSWDSSGPACTGLTYTLISHGTPGGLWTGNAVEDQGNGTAFFMPSEPGLYTITYTAGSGGCQASLAQDIEVWLMPDAGWTIPAGVCSGQMAPLIPDGSIGGVWTGESVIDHGDGTATFSPAESGVYTVMYQVNNGPCKDSLTQQIEVVNLPDATWPVPDNVCEGREITLIPSGSPGGMWSGNGVTDLGNGTALFIGSSAGLYSITYTIGQADCQSSLTQDITVFPVPDPSWTPPANICQEEQVTLVPDGTPGGTWTGSAVTDLGNGTALFMPSLPGMYEVTYSISLGPCMAMLSQNIEVSAFADPSWTVPPGVCVEEEILLVPDSTFGGMWTGPGVVDQGNGTALFLQDAEGVYPVTYEVGEGSCTQSLTQDIQVISPGDPFWDPPGNIICPGEIVDLNAPQGDWSGEGVTNFGNGVGQFQAIDFDIYIITLTVTNGDCSASASHPVEVGDFDPPVIEVPASDMNVLCDGSGNLSELQEWLDTHGGAVASDACSDVITWDHDFSGFPFDCGMAGTVLVTFTAFDEFGNFVTTSGEFTIEDNMPPVLEGVPGDAVVPCDAIPPPAPVTAEDLCSGNTPVEFEEIPPGPNCPYEIIRIWTATDDCGNMVSDQQLITAIDNMPPVAENVPNDTIIHCPGPPVTCIPPPDPPTYTDNCDTDPQIEMTEEIQNFPGGIQITRCWVGIDDCNNVSPMVCQNIIIMQIIPPGMTDAFSLGIDFFVSTFPSYIHSDLFSSALHPNNINWTDPGWLPTLSSVPNSIWTFTSPPSFAVKMEWAFRPWLTMVLAGSRSANQFLLSFPTDREAVLLKGHLEEINYSAGIQFLPKRIRPLYFTISPQYTTYHVSHLTLDRPHYILQGMDLRIHPQLSMAARAGVHFDIFNAGRMNIEATWRAPREFRMEATFHFCVSSLFQNVQCRLK